MAKVKQPKAKINRNVSNQSVRTDRIKLLVIHTTEGPNRDGLGDLEGLADYFDSPKSQVSSTVAIDGEGFSARLMPDASKPWTQASYNSVSLSIENIGYSATTRDEWFKKYPRQLAANSRWLAYWSDKHKIPLRRAVTLSGGVQKNGVATHKQLGVYGGNHGDPGRGYPIKYVLLLARYIKLKAKNPKSAKFKRVRKKVNRIRKHYNLKPLK